jgi:putative peptidoglycan lipid II flippase
MTFISRISGFLRDMLAAQMFGAGMGYDAFLIAFKIPNFMRRLFAEGAFSQAFVPVLAEYRSTQGEKEVKLLVDRVAGALGAVLLLVTIVGMLAAPLLIRIFAPGFEGDERFAMATQMLRITFPYALLISLAAFAGGILNTYGRFATPAITPVLLNLSIIGCAIFLSPYLNISVEALAWGVLLGGFLQLFYQLPHLHRLQLLPKPVWAWHDTGVQRILGLMLPAIFGASVSQINLIVDSIFASFLPVGSVSWLYYADRLIEFPLGVFGVAIATVMLPNLSAKHATQPKEAFALTVDWGLRWVMVIGLPAMVGLWLLADPILITLFHYGHYTEMDVLMTSKALLAMTVGLMGFLSVKILISAFYATQDTRFPVKVGIVVLLTNIILNFIFIKPFAHAGLALSTSIAALLNAVLLFIELWRRGLYHPRVGWLSFMARLVLGNIVMAITLRVMTPQFGVWTHMHFGERFLTLGVLVGTAAVVYGLTLFTLGLRRHHVRQLS